MSSVAQICPKCARPIPPSAPKGLCSRCLISTLLDEVAEDDTAGAEPMPAPAAPSERVGNYELLEQIGRGGMGVVFRARDLRLNRVVALKLIVAGKLASQLEVKRFLAEATSAARLEHPNIVPIYEVGEAEGRHFFAMKLMERGTLVEEMAKQDRTRAASPSDIRHSTSLLAKIARAVHHAHQRGILHRDLKPGNILLDTNGEPMVTDFGLARQLEGDSDLTLSGTVLGSPSYMAPEQAVGRAREVTTAADIYSLGAVLFHSLTGQPPFRESSAVATMRAVVENEPPRPSALNPGVDHDLATICLKCLEKEPARRYTSAAALADDLERWQRNEPILARPPGAAERVWKWARRRPASAALVLVSLTALVGFLALQFASEAKLTFERDHARRQENLAKASERVTRENLYAADMLLTHRAIEEGNLALARRTLEHHLPRAGEEDLRGFEWRYFWKRSAGEQRHVLHGFSNAVTAVAFSPDGRWLAGAGGKVVQWWSATNQQLSATLPHDNVVRSLCFSPDGTTLWTGDSRGKVRVWLAGRDRWVGLISRGTGYVHIAAPAGAANYVAFGERDGVGGKAQGAVALYTFFDVLSRNERGNVLTNSGGLAAFSRDGKSLLTGGGTSPLRFWNLVTGETKTLTAGEREISAVALSLDGRTAAACTYNAYGLVLLDLASGKDTWVHHQGLGTLGTPAFSPDGTTLAVPCGDHSVTLLDARTGQLKRRLLGHTAEVLAVAFSADGATLASCGKDQTVRLWSLASDPDPDLIKEGLPPYVFSPDGRTLTTATTDNWTKTFHQFDLASRQCISVPQLVLRANQYPHSPHPDSGAPLRWLLYGGASSNQWSKFLDFMSAHTNFTASACSENGGVVALGRRDGVVVLWDNFNSVRLGDLKMRSRKPHRLALTPDGRTLASVGQSNLVTVWDVASGTNLFFLPAREGAVADLIFSPDGRTLATGNEDTTVELRDAMTGELQATLLGHHAAVNGLAFSPDGRTLVSAAGETLKLWHVATRREVATLTRSGPKDYPMFSPDGTTLMTAHWNGTVRLWRAPTP